MIEWSIQKPLWTLFSIIPISHQSPPHPSGHEQLVLGYEQFPPFIQNPGLQSAIHYGRRDIIQKPLWTLFSVTYFTPISFPFIWT